MAENFGVLSGTGFDTCTCIRASFLCCCYSSKLESNSDLRKAVEQVVADYEIPKSGADFLEDFVNREDGSIVDYLVPFMTNSTSASQISTIVRKSLIYDLLVKMSGIHDSTLSDQTISLQPLIAAICTLVFLS